MAMNMKQPTYSSILLVLLVSFSLPSMGKAENASQCDVGRPEQSGGLPSVKSQDCYLDGSTLIVKGVLGSRVLKTLKENPVEKVILNSPGGTMHTSVSIAEWIRSHNINTEIPQQGYCFSSCTLVFQSGIQRSAYESSSIGYHCIGVAGRMLSMIIQQECGRDLTPDEYVGKCKADLEDIIASSTKSTEEYFSIIESYGSNGIFELMMNQPEDPVWFETGNFCKHNVKFHAKDTMQFGVVNNLISEIEE